MVFLGSCNAGHFILGLWAEHTCQLRTKCPTCRLHLSKDSLVLERNFAHSQELLAADVKFGNLKYTEALRKKFGWFSWNWETLLEFFIDILKFIFDTTNCFITRVRLFSCKNICTLFWGLGSCNFSETLWCVTGSTITLSRFYTGSFAAYAYH